MFSVLRDLLPLHCILRGSLAAPQSFIGVALATTIVGLLYLSLVEFSANSPGKLMGLVMNAGGVVYLSLTYRRIQEFVKAQQPPDTTPTKQSAEIGG